MSAVQDSLDGASTDWTVSGDAMQWSPAEPLSAKWSGPIPMTDELVNDWPFFDGCWFVINHEPQNDAVPIPVDDTAWRGPDQEPQPPDRSDVRAHALWRAQHRNTGPQRPTAGQSKRPRRP